MIGGVPVALGRTDWALLAQQLAATAPRAHRAPRGHPPTKYDRRLLGGVPAADVRYRELRPGARILAGTILAHAARSSATKAGQISFEIRPAGRNSPLIEPRPVVAGWKLLLDRQALQRRVLADRRILLGPCDRDRIRAGRIDRRVLAAVELLAVSDLHPTVSALQCGLTRIAATGKVSRHWTGDAVDISAINNIPVLGNQGPGSISELAIRRLLLLQGSMKPDHIMSLVRLDGADNTLLNARNPDHIHIGFRHALRNRSIATRISDGALEASAWRRLGSRLGAIDNPAVRAAPSRYARLIVTDPPAGTADPPAAP